MSSSITPCASASAALRSADALRRRRRLGAGASQLRAEAGAAPPGRAASRPPAPRSATSPDFDGCMLQGWYETVTMGKHLCSSLVWLTQLESMSLTVPALTVVAWCPDTTSKQTAM